MSKAQLVPSGFVSHADGVATITLSRAFDMDGLKQSTLQMREPTVNDQLVMDARQGSDASKEVALFADLCGLTPADLGRLPMKDYGRLQAAYAGFLA